MRQERVVTLEKSGNSDSTTLDERAGAWGRYSLADYLVVNLMVWGLLVIVGLIAYFGIDEAPVVPFLLLVVGCGFTVVSVYDYMFDRMAARSDERGRAES